METDKNQKNPRRDFLKLGLLSGASAIAGVASLSGKAEDNDPDKSTGEKMKVLTPDGKLVEIDKKSINNYPEALVTPEESRKGVPGRKFVMFIDLSKCKNARACIEKCQQGHDLLPNQEFMNVQLMQDTAETAPYWFPKPCQHCEYPPCVKVCPTGATFQRDDNIVLVDNEKCIGCKFCITSCPYSARIFNWQPDPSYENSDMPYSPETSVPGQMGTVSKCDFCADLSRAGKLPHCVTACPMGVIYFGDRNEDIVTNGDETLRFSELINDGAAYQYLEELGTQPNVYYLPPVNRQFPVDRGFDHDEETLSRYERVPYVQEMKKKANQ
jgi:Fe-S-cluster-containing dehydrogenase component